ncbi:GRAM domain-containing protein 2B-like isoform X1 [Euwallacea fornicatus]|uniref:GRAM domain-containing protein 2B-like isoform X1 n=1 Tax=Euwallacea fornicatus TaxID=995702 RepID=UPI00338DDDBD
MEQPDSTSEPKSKHFGKIFKGTMHNFVKSISKDTGTTNSCIPPPETEASDKEDEFELVDLPKNDCEPQVLLNPEAVLYLSKSVENLNTHPQHKKLKRNSSDTRLDERETDNQSLQSLNDHKYMHSNSKENESAQTPAAEQESSDFEDVEGQLHQQKSLNLRKVISRSVRGSLRLVKSIGPKNEGETANKEKRRNLFKKFATSIVENAESPAQLCLQPPTPLLVEVPPDTDDEPPHDLRTLNPALLNGSSGNFGSAGPRSAPATPQGQLGAPQGALPEPLASSTIQRSPSHSVFSKVDKSNLKHLSTSTPAMTAQGQLTEPPSPKATKDPKVHTTSKARQKKFLRHFPTVEEDEKVLNYYSCALIGDILLQGHLYITKNYFAFYSNVFGYVTKLLIPILSVEEITKEKTARIIPNAVGITTGEYKHIFGSLMSRDNTLAYMKTVWEKAKSEETLPEPEIIEPDQDSSESGESERESPVAEDEEVPPPTEVLKRIRKESVRNQTDGSLLERKGSKGFVRTLKDAITEFRKLPRQSLILVATTLLLILLFLSAAVLLYRIHKIQNKYSISLQGASLSSTSEDIYSDLLQWQTHLHSRSADAVNNFLDSNLDQIAKVRQSLEALSALLIGQNAKQQQSSKEYVFRDDSSKVTLQTNRES